MNSEVEPWEKKKKKTNPTPWLPDELVVSCLARISRSYYPKLSLVCKRFGSLVLSKDLSKARVQFKTDERFFHVCLQLSNTHRPIWFSLWIKPNKTLNNAMEKRRKFTGNILLVPTPSSYYPRLPIFMVRVGSDTYKFIQCNARSPVMLVYNQEARFWRRAPNMTVARENPFVGVLNGKIYVMGGCEGNESAIRAEVFDTKTQTWEPLPDPGPEIRFSKFTRLDVYQGKLYLISNNEQKDYVYDPKQGKWNVAANSFLTCVIGNTWYGWHRNNGCVWYDTKSNKWTLVRGLSVLNMNLRGRCVEITNYREKFLILWDKFVNPGRNCQEKYIWCAVIAFERRNGNDEVWGNVEWSSIVLTVPSSYVFLRRRQTWL